MDRAVPGEALAELRGAVQCIGVVGFRLRDGAEVAQLEVDRLQFGAKRPLARIVLEIGPAVANRELADVETQRSAVFGPLWRDLWGGRKVCEVDAAAFADHDARVGRIECDFREARPAPPDACDVKIHQQAAE